MMHQNKNNENAVFMWRVISLHTIAYFAAGIFALVFMNYKEQFASEIMSVIMRPVESPWTAAGPGLQIIRGAIIGLVLLPFREIITAKNGWLKLSGLILGLSYLSTIGPAFGSFEGYIYTKIPLGYHLLGIPEMLLYTFLFTFFLSRWYKKESKAWNICSVVLVVLIILMSILGYLSAVGLLKN